MIVFPKLLPTSGNFLGPKTRAATPAITASSGTPRPNKALQVRPFLALSVLVLILVLPRTKALLLTLFLFKNELVVAPLVKKVDWDEEKGSEGGHLGVDRVKDEISMSA